MRDISAKVTNSTKSASGASLRGYLKADFDMLVSRLGQPIDEPSADGKVPCEWVLEFNDGSIATIYCWKTGTIPLDLHDWHIGGKGINVVEKVGKFLHLPVLSTLF